MQLMDLIAERPLVWGLFVGYMALTSYLAWLGHKKTTDIKSFAVGAGDMSPVVVGITLAASIASTATFVINPGFVYVHGVSAIMHLGVAAGLGIILGLVVMSVGFRRIGQKTGAITLPGWMGQRYRSKGLAVFFAALNLLSLSFVVLILGGVSIVMQTALGLGNVESLLLIATFVFGYVFVGGTYAHAYTNTLQGIIMVGVSGIIVLSGAHLFSDGVGAFFATVGEGRPELVALINPESPLFGSFFSVFVSGFVIGFALVCQPHIMTKALYVKSDKDVRRYLGVTVAVSLVFTALLLVGLYARVMGLGPEAFVDPATGLFSQDRVMAVYLTQSFGPSMMAIVTVALLAAGMSTLDGILVALSTIVASDLFVPVAERSWLAKMSESDKARIAHRVSQGVLVAMGVAAVVISLDPPALLGIFGQIGVYGIVAASTAPILGGILSKRIGSRAAFSAALTGLVLHFGLVALGRWSVGAGVDLRVALGPIGGAVGGVDPALGLQNPAVTATVALLASGLVVTVARALAQPLGSVIVRADDPSRAADAG